MIKSLQISRGFAAVAVVFYHTWLIIFQYSGHSIAAPIAAFGFLGVNYFFILSGFIILMAHEKDLGEPSTLSRYAYRRFSRVYPAYWVYLTGFILVAATGFGKPDFSWAPADLLQSYALVYLHPPSAAPPLHVAWTLFYEIRFYIIFAILILNRKAGIVVLIAWTALILAQPRVDGLAIYFISYWNLNFIFGMIAFIVYSRIPARFWPVPLGFGILGLLVALSRIDVLSIKDENAIYIIPIGLALALTLLGIVMLEAHKPRPVSPSLMFIGNASYSIYLVHSAAISAAVIVAKRLELFGRVPDLAIFLSIFVLAVCVGSAAFLLVEKPLGAAFRRFNPGQRVAS